MILRLIVTISLVITLSACNDDPPLDSVANSVERGKVLFYQTHIGKSLGCITCHSFSTDIKTVGPSLLGIGLRAGLSKPNMTAKAYLFESITNPDAHIVVGYEPNIMYSAYASELTKTQIEDLINFLLGQ